MRAGDGTNKKPRPDGGVLGIGLFAKYSAHAISSPREGTFFRQRYDTRNRDHARMMIVTPQPVNGGHFSPRALVQKKAGLEEPGLRYWPREADTITFQEGLLNVRATGGGGQMRNAKAQRPTTMSLA